MDILSEISCRPGGAFPLLDEAALRALELLGFPLYIYDFETQRICWSNASSRKFWNAREGEDLRQRVLTPYSASTQTRLAEYLDAFARGDDRVESWTFYPHGQATPALCRCSGVSLEGHPHAMLVEIQSLPVTLPVSELRAIEALRHTPLKISLFSESGQVLMRNPAAMACFRKLDESLPETADHLRAMFAEPEVFELLMADARETRVASRRATMSVEGWPVHNVQLSLVSDPATGQAAVLVAQQDTSRLVQMSRQLEASEDALDMVLSLNVAATLVLDAQDGTMLSVNHAVRSLLGEIGSGAEMVAEQGGWQALRRAVLSSGGGSVQTRLKRANGVAFWASVSGLRISYKQQDAIVLLVTDIDQIYRAAEDLEAALDSERRTSEMQRRFLAIASHEFRTPLAVIDSSAQRLEREGAALAPDQVRGRANRIRSAVKRLLGLLDNTIERARANESAMGYEPHAGHLEDLIAQVAQSSMENHPGLEIALELPALPELVFDRGLMEQAFVNLFSNAFKYSHGDLRVEVRAAVSSEDVQIFVRDHGIGVPPEERARIFSDYVRGSNVGTRAGTGLGLAIVSQVMGLHGGLIDILDTEGEGTTFRLVLPRP
jgi:signal transduction histidine kinase